MGNQFSELKQELKIRRYSQRTINSYVYFNEKFLTFYKKTAPEIQEKDVKNYLEHLINKNLSGDTIRLIYNALKFYYKEVLNKDIMDKIKIPKRDKKITVGLTKDEINKLISVVKNIKHKLLLELIYGSGLRASEAVNVKVKDILIDENIVIIKAAKGRKERKTILSDKFIENYKKINNTNSYLFPGRTGHLSTRTIQQIIKQATKKAKINKRTYPHLLRHAFATHLFENDVKTKYIQHLLGHKDKKTTEGYIQIRNKNILKVKSPRDLL